MRVLRKKDVEAMVPFINKGWQIWFGPELQNGWSVRS